jgi:predicted permease
MLHDLRYALRSLRKSPGFTAIAVISLALGIGANLAVFEFIDAAILKPLPAEHPADLVSLYQESNKLPGSFTTCSYPEFEFYRDHNTVFAGMLAYLRVPMNIGTGAEAREIAGELISPDYFATLGLRPVIGRFLASGDADATVISYSLWRERFAADPDISGRRIRIGAGDFTIVGVAPEKFRGIVMDWAEPPSAWIPVSHHASALPALNFDIVHEWGMQSYLVTARLRPGVTIQQAQAQMTSLTARLREARGMRKNESPLLFPVQEARFWPSYRGSIFTFLGALMTLVAAVLLIGCCNLASLLLARAANRRREIAIRLAIGAGRARIARQLVVEGLLISFIGCGAAVLVAAFVSRFLEEFHRPFGIRLAIEPGWNIRVFAFAFAVSVAAGLFFGAAPLLQTWRWGVNDDMRSNTPTRSYLRNIFVVAQVALSTILLAGSALFVRTLANARAEDPTLRPENLLAVALEPAIPH